jgi:hypothetical protein
MIIFPVGPILLVPHDAVIAFKISRSFCVTHLIVTFGVFTMRLFIEMITQFFDVLCQKNEEKTVLSDSTVIIPAFAFKENESSCCR